MSEDLVKDQRLILIEGRVNFGEHLVEMTDEPDLEFEQELKANLNQALIESRELRAELMED